MLKSSNGRRQKNDAVLQTYVIMEQGHEIRLVLDCRTRWSSLWNMMEIFYRLRKPIQKACIDVRAPVNLTDADFETVREIVSALEPPKVTVEALCRRETNLIAANAALRFAIIELEKQTSELSRTLAAALRKQVAERQTDLSGLLQYLCDPKAPAADETFSIPSSGVIKKLLHALLKRLDSKKG